MLTKNEKSPFHTAASIVLDMTHSGNIRRSRQKQREWASRKQGIFTGFSKKHR